MDARWRNVAVAALVVFVLILLVVYARSTCRLGRFSAPACPGAKGAFCGAAPDPAAGAEAAGLFEMGLRAGPEGFAACGGGAAAPGAAAEAAALMQTGWRPEHLRARPPCGPPRPEAIAEAQALQHAGGMRPQAPYWTPADNRGEKSTFIGGGAGDDEPPELGDGDAAGLAHVMSALQAGPADQGLAYPEADVDGFAARQLVRDRAAYSSTVARSEALRSNPAQVSARRARLDSMREGFGGPAQPGFGWAPADTEASAVPAAACVSSCADGCTGTHCTELCVDQCART